MNIKKFQSGGESLPFVDYMPFEGVGAATDSGTTSSKKSKDSDKENSSNIGIKDLLNLTKDLDGLPSDIARITQSMKRMYHNASLFNDGELSTSDLVNTYLSTLQKIKVANINKDEYNAAKSEVIKNGGLHEAAIDEYGNVLCQNRETGEMTKMSVKEYFDNYETYAPLTNSNLLRYRYENNGMAFNNTFLDIVSNGIGEEKITKMIQSAIAAIGSSELSKEGYTEKQQNDIQGGLELLQEAHNQGLLNDLDQTMPIDGLYKFGLTSKDSQQQISMAMNYLMKTMPQNARAWLQLRGGNTENPEEGARSLLASLMFAKNTTQNKFDIDLKKNPDGKGSDDTNNEKGNTNLDPAKAFILGMGYQKEFQINTGNSYSVTVNGRFGILTNHQGEPLKEYSSLADVSQGQYAGILDISNATFGGSKIESLNKAFILNSDIIGIDLPIDIEYKAQTGITRPDIKLASKIEQLHTAIKQGQLNPDDANAINNFCVSIGLPQMYSKLDENGIPQLNNAQYARFARISALVDENGLSENTNVDDTVSEANDQRRENFKTYMQSVDKNYSLSDGFFGMGKDNLFEGAIYIPVREDLISASLGGNNYYKLKGQDAITVAQKFADEQKLQTYQQAPTLGELRN